MDIGKLLETCSSSGMELNNTLQALYHESQNGNWDRASIQAIKVAFILGETTACHRDVSREGMLSFMESLGDAVVAQNLNEVERVIRGIESNFSGVEVLDLG